MKPHMLGEKLSHMKESIIQEMREKGLKLTPQRLTIIEFLAEKGALHPGASLIYEQLRKNAKGLSLSTVYLTLKELHTHGIIKMLEFDKMENRCETNKAMHVNLICKICHNIKDYPTLPLEPGEVLKRARFWVSDTRLEYYGYCEQCRSQKLPEK